MSSEELHTEIPQQTTTQAFQVQSDKVVCIANRGGGGEQRENSLEAFAGTLELGLSWMHCDVRYTDGRLLAFRDRRLERMTARSGTLEELSSEELRHMIADEEESVAELSEVLEVIGGRAGMYLELRGPACAEPTVRLIETHVREKGWQFEQFLVHSLDHHQLLEVKRLNPRIAVGAQVIGRPLDYAECAARLGAAVIHLSVDFITKEFVHDAHQRGVGVVVSTINHEQDARLITELRVQGMVTDNPAMFLQEQWCV